MAEKRLLLPPFPLFNVAVMLSRTLTYMLTYNIDLEDWEGGGGRESGLTELTKFCKLTLDYENF